MKQLFTSVFGLLMLCVSSMVFAVQPKDTLTVERIIIIGNGTSSGKSITSHVFTKRFFDEATCVLARDKYRLENSLKIGAGDINSDVATKAECDALDTSSILLQIP